jgi:hypothetical protein
MPLTPTTLKEASLATDAAWMVRGLFSRAAAKTVRRATTASCCALPLSAGFSNESQTSTALQVFFYTQSHGTSVGAAPAFLQVADG